MIRSILLVLAIPSVITAANKNSTLFYEREVRPVLKAYCFECHGEDKRPKGGLDLRLRRLMVEGGNDGPAIVPGESAKSLLVKRIQAGEMPPGKHKLSPQEIDLLAKWIDQGAKTLRPEPKEVKPGLLITEEERNHWSFQPIQRPVLPSVNDNERLRTPIDAFLLAKLESHNLTFSPEASRETLIRRATFDLLGLPPTPKEIHDFVHDTSPNAWERLIDRLLASPHYGERWGRHWLDVAGYADSEGYDSTDPVRPYAWKYRDYVFRSFNNDKPFDRFIQEQLAGDEMVKLPYTKLSPEQLDCLIATGFLRMAPDGTGVGGVNQPLARNQVMAETIKIVSTSLMGMTVGCAQCHHHRYDPIPQDDYYRMRAIFEPALDWKKWRSPASRRVVLFTSEQRNKANEIEKEAKKIDQERLKKQQEYIDRTVEKQLKKLPEAIRQKVHTAYRTPVKKRTAEQKKLLRENPSVNVSAGSLYLYDRKAADELKAIAARATKLRGTKPQPKYIRALTETAGRVPATFLFHRGDHEQPKEKLTPGGLTILTSLGLPTIPVNDNKVSTTGRRLAFARRLTDGKHPLTARVLMNRVWLNHFGQGIVNTPADFGTLGEKPSNPQLLDWLASEFMNSGWKLKHMHKLMMMSTTYRQSSRRNVAQEKVDPDNRLLGRMSVRRLEAESVRDTVLAISGQLNDKAFGKPVPVTVDLTGMVILGVDTRDSAGRPTKKRVSLNGEEYRRSVYIQVRRSMPLAVLETFDAPILSPNCEVRNTSTVAPQSLLLMNSQFVTKYARHFAERLQREAKDDMAKQVTLAWQLAFGTEPDKQDISAAKMFLESQTKNFRSLKDKKINPQLEALANFCQALMSANAFLYVD